jgi:hypothetical protein
LAKVCTEEFSIMDVAALAAVMMTALAGQTQQSIAVDILRQQAQSQAAIANLIDPALQNGASLANLPSGVGNSVNVSA